MSGRARVKPARVIASGEKRYDVAFRLGGHGWKEHHGGTFTTKAIAQARADLLNSIIASSATPEDAWTRIRPILKRAIPAARRNLATVVDDMLRGSVDNEASTLQSKRTAANRFTPTFGDRDPHLITPLEIQEWVIEWTAKVAPSTLRYTHGILVQALEYADVTPNPAKHKNVKLPRQVAAEPSVPSWAEVQAILAEIRPRAKYELPVELAECHGLRVGEIAKLTWDDVDFRGRRLRISRTRTKGRTAGQRWLPVPEPLMEKLERIPPDDRTGQVFPDLTEDAMGDAMRRACKRAGIATYSPHDLRDRRASLWSAQGTPDALLARRGGWTGMDVPRKHYLHVIAPDDDIWADFWRTALERAE